MLLSLIFYIIVTLIIIVLVWNIPSVYDLGSFSKVYDLYAIISKEYKITSPTNIVTKYFPSNNIQTVANITYYIDASTNTINLKINNIDYSFPITTQTTKQIVYPILLGAQ